MKMRWVLSIFVLFIGFSSSIFGIELSSTDLISLNKVETMQHIQYQSYLQTDKGPAGVIGYYFDRYFTKNSFYSIGIFGAVSGNRGGYGVAAIGLGHRFVLSNSVDIELRSLVGSGGGGGVPAGGGLAIFGGVACLAQLWPNAYLDAGYSWLQFPSGTLNTPVIHLGIALKSSIISL